MGKELLAGFFVLVLTATVQPAAAQQQSTSEKKDKNTQEKTVEKAKEVGSGVAHQAESAKDKTVDTTKAVGEKTKDVVKESGRTAEKVKDKSVETTKKGIDQVGETAGDVKEQTAKGVHVANESAKKTGNWFTRAFKKIF